MGVLKDLIVQGKSKFLSDTYLSYVKGGTWNGNPVDIAYGGTGATSIEALSQSLNLNHVYRNVSFTAAASNVSAKYDVTDPLVTEYYDGMVVCIKVTGAGNDTYGSVFQINDLGYKPIVYNVNSTIGTRYSNGAMLWMVYNSTQTATYYLGSSGTSTGCWQIMDYNVNTMGYLIRTNSQTMTLSGACYRYRLLFTSADGTQYVPANTSTSINATDSRTVNQTPIDPFGNIFYYGSSIIKSSGTSPAATVLYQQYNITLGYSFNRTGLELTLTTSNTVYIKCAPQANGSAIIDSTNPFVQALPTSADGKIYIFLGIATSATAVELCINHPVYHYADGGIKLWTGANVVPSCSSSDAGKVLSIDSNGNMVWVSPSTIYIGADPPSGNLGKSGDIYLQLP